MKERGITLIALVITIIVLLILAGVTINMVLGDDGIIAQAKESTEVNKEGRLKEAVKVYEAEKEIEKNGGTAARTEEEFFEDLFEENLVIKKEPHTIKLKNGDSLYA